jgi:pimeloyl-[acyl-carrier protein] synthase
MSASLATQFNPLSPDFHVNPYPHYAALHEYSPVLFVPEFNSWFVASYEGVTTVCKDAHFGFDIFKVMTPEELGWPETPENIRPLHEMRDSWMLHRDPPVHTHLRKVVHKAFTPRMIEHLRDRAQAITDDLIDKAQANGGMDLIAEFAFLLPISMITGMLGVPSEEAPSLRRWSTSMIDGFDWGHTPERAEQGAKAVVEFSAYLRAIIAERRINPQGDLISALITTDADGDRLNEDELVSMCVFLLFAGYETTINLIGNGMLALLRQPDQWEKLKANPTLIKSAVEELLRYDSPVQMNGRWVMADTELAGQQLKRGQFVAPLFGAANRDPARFPNPDVLDITRDPNPHIAFGSGIHFCLGAPLARMEGQIAFATLACRLPNLTLVDEKPAYRNMHLFRGLAELPVTF